MKSDPEVAATPEQYRDIREAVRELCLTFPDEYWQALDGKGEYPTEFVGALTAAGWLAILIPEEYGGGGQPVGAGCVVLEAINRFGGDAASAHAQMYTMGTILRHGSEYQKSRYLPGIATGALRLQAFGVTEPDAGSDTTRIRTFAVRDGDDYIVNGSKIFTSRFFHSDLMLLLVRTTPYGDVERKTDGLSVLLVDLRDARDTIRARPIETMLNHETAELFFDDLRVPATNLVGEEGRGFRYIVSGLNAERLLVSSEVLGTGFWFIERASEYAGRREVFGRPIGSNQGVQFPLAKAYTELLAANYLRWAAVASFEAGNEPRLEANVTKYLASNATWAAANAAMDAYGGYGVTREYGIERRFRHSRLSLVAPVSNNLVLAQVAHDTLGLPKSY